MTITNLLITLFGLNCAAAAPLDLSSKVSETLTGIIWSTTDITYTITVTLISSPATEIAAQYSRQARIINPLSGTGIFETQEPGTFSPTSLDSSPTSPLIQSEDQNLDSVQITSSSGHSGHGYGYNGLCSESNPVIAI